MIFKLHSVLRDRAAEADGGGSSIDRGAAHFHDVDEKPNTPVADKSETDKRFERIEADLKAAKAEASEQRDLAKYWADRSKAGKPAADPDPDPEPEVPVRRQARAARPDEKPEELLDDVSKEGLGALLKRGLITEEEFDKRLNEMEENITKRVQKTIDNATVGAEFDQKLGREFPELLEDNARVTRGEQPKSELFTRTAQHFRQMVEDSGVKADSAAARGLMYTAAKLAKKELDMEGKDTRRRSDDREDKEDTRRRRIEAQGGERGGGGNDEEGTTLTATQRQIMKNLGVKEVDFVKHQDGGARGR